MFKIISRVNCFLLYIVLFAPLMATGGPSWEVKSAGVVNQQSGVLVPVVETLSRFAKGTQITFSGGGLLVLTADAAKGAVTLTGDLRDGAIAEGEIGSSIDTSLSTSITFYTVPKLNAALPAAGDKVGAFVYDKSLKGDLLRGEGSVVIYEGKSYCVITVFLKVGDTVRFKLYDSTQKKTIDENNSLTINSTHMAAQQIGDPSFLIPYILNFNETKDKISAIIKINNLQHTYDGLPKSASATTDPPGLNVTFAFKDSANAPITELINAGSYSVFANVADGEYLGAKTEMLIIKKATPVITANSSHLIQFDLFNDEEKEVKFIVTPDGLAEKYVVSYKKISDGEANYTTIGPSRIGEYDIKAIVDSENHYGIFTGKLEIVSTPKSWGQLDVQPNSNSKTIDAIVSVDGLPAGSNNLLGAFVNGNLRGLQHLNTPLDKGKLHSYFVINAGGDPSSEIVNFKLYDYSKKSILDISDNFTLAGNIGSYNSPVVLGFDATPPVIKLNGEALVSHEAGSVYADSGASALDAVDGAVTVAIKGAALGGIPGDYTLTYTAIDKAGNKAKTVLRKVSVKDTTGPVITLNGDKLVSHEAGASYTDRGANAEDLVDGVVLVRTIGDVNQNKPGLYTLIYNAIDAAGNKSSDTRTVNVQDTTGPVIKLKGKVMVTQEAGSSYTDAGASAVDVVDGDLSGLIEVLSTVDVSKTGSYTVSYGMSDSNGNAAEKVVRVVKVVDTTVPVITLSGDSTVTHEAKGAYVDAGAKVSDTLDGDLSSSVTKVSTVNTDAVGSYSVTYSVSDANGNAAVEVVRTVKVVDTTVPVIALSGSSVVTQQAKGAYVDGGASASDTLDGDLTVKVKSVSTVNTDAVGSYSVTYRVSDSNGNVAVEVVRVVNVVDTTVPVITLSGDSTVTHEAKGAYVDAGAKASDTLDGDLSSSVTRVSTVNTDAVGSYSVTYSVSDSNGNVAVEVLRAVNVVDTTVPVITLSGDSTVTHESKETYVDGGARASDTLDGNLTGTVKSVSTVNTDAVGSYSVTYSVSDANGNVAVEVVRVVNVVDTTVPVITLSGDSTVTHEAKGAYVDAGAKASDTLDGDLSSSVTRVSTVKKDAVGSYSVTYSVSDANGNAAVEVVRAVKVVDTTVPVITLSGSSTVTHEAKGVYVDAGAKASDTLDGDLSSSVTRVSTVNTDAVGSYSVTYRVSDSNGNAAEKVVRTVKVVDTTVPVITLSGDSTVTHEAKETYVDGGARASDTLDGNLTGTVKSVSTVNTDLVGSYSVTYSVSDFNGNAAEKVVRAVKVVDTTVPVITLSGNSTVTHEAKETYVDGGARASDTLDGNLTGTVKSVSTVNTDVVGRYSVTYSVSDANGNAAVEVVRAVKVVDTTVPVITLSGSSTVTHEAKGAYVDAGAKASDTLDGDLSSSVRSVSTVNTDAVGSYSVTYRVSDANGNAAVEVVRTVKVVDTTVPVITLSGGSTVTHEAKGVYVDGGVSASDTLDGDLSSSVTRVSTVNKDAVGSYSVTYSVSDSNGNAAEKVVRTVKVVDTTVPVITLSGDSTVTHESKETYVDGGARASDTLDGNLTGTVKSVSTVNTDAVGRYSVTYSVSDFNGNAAVEVVRVVNVVDTTAPVITLLGRATIQNEVLAAFIDPGVTVVDSVDGNLVPVITGTVDVNTVGTYVLKYNAKDSSGNTAVEAQRIVTIGDTGAPVISLNGDVLVMQEAKGAYVDGGATATDTLDGVLTVKSVSTVNTDVVGSYSVTYRVSDSNGNAAEKVVRVVKVVDTTVPVITLSGDSTVTHEAKGAYVEAGAKASDTLDGDLSSSVTRVSTVNTDAVGSYSVTYSVSDANGNAAVEVVRTVKVVDTTVPVITLSGNSTVTHESKETYVDGGARASDTLDGNLTGTVKSVSTVNTDLVGSYSVTYRVSDANGNAAEKVVRAVKVVDTTVPVITLSGDSTVTHEAKGVYVDAGAKASDTLDGDLTSSVRRVSTVKKDAVGSYSVTYRVSDANRNAAVEVVRVVNVVDTTVPVITLSGGSTVTHEAKGVYVDGGVSASDTLDGDLSSSVTRVSTVNKDAVGSYSVTYSVSDANGNAAVEVVRTVKVVDTTVPVITLSGNSTVTHEAKETYVDGGARASDTLDGNLTGTVKSVSTVNTDVVGRYSVTYSVSDANGNAAVEVVRAVKVVDTTVPVITLSGSSTVTHEAKGAYVDAGAKASDTLDGDLSGSVTKVSTVNKDAVGSYSVTYSVSDANGNAAVEVVRVVNVVDTTVPVITLSGGSTVTHEAKGVYVDAGAKVSDTLDGDLSSSVTRVSTVNTDAVGSYSVTYRVSDANENAAVEVVRTVKVVDTTVPVITLSGGSTVTHEAKGVYVDGGVSASDTLDGDLTVKVKSVSTVNTDAVGSYSVTYRVSDAKGNAAEKVVRAVKVVDTTVPVITLSGSSTVTHEAKETYVDGGARATDTLDGNLTGTLKSVSAVNTDLVGSYSVTYSASDANGNAAVEVVRVVKVVDTTVPVITLSGSSTVTLEAKGVYVDAGARATDTLDGNLTGTLKSVSAVNTDLVGSYSVTYSVSDANGNAAVEVVRTVKVVDTTVPVITLSGSSTVTHEAGSSYTDLGATAMDMVDGDLSEEVGSVGTVDIRKLGAYTLSYGVSDAAGNKAKGVMRTVTVVDTTPPVIKLKGEVELTLEAGGSYTDAGASAVDVVDGDLSGELEVVSTVNTSRPGVYAVSYGVSDAVGNKARAAVRKVTVVDTTGPVITLNGLASVNHEAGGSYKDGGASATDVVDGAVSVQTSGDVNQNKPGSYTLVYSAVDSLGNVSAKKERTVKVEDTTRPVITLKGPI